MRRNRRGRSSLRTGKRCSFSQLQGVDFRTCWRIAKYQHKRKKDVMKALSILSVIFGLFATSTLVAADRQVVIEPASWMTFSQQVMTSKVNSGKNLRAGVFHMPGKRLMRVFTVSEFTLPAASADEVRMASLQLVPGRRQCKGDSPLALSLYAYAGDGAAEFTDTQGGAVVQTLEDACHDTTANAQPIDVTSEVKAQLTNGATFIGFSMRPASDRIGEAMINFHGPTASDGQRHRLIVVLAGRSGGGTGATSAPSFDISGVRLGMTPEETRRTLQARSRDYQFKDHRAPIDRQGSAPFLSMVTATLPERTAAGPLESYGVQFPPPPHDHRAIFVERYGVFRPGQEPLLDEVKASLVKKYGEPSHVDDRAPETTLVWAFNPAGTQMVEKSVLRRCVRHIPTDPLSLARPNELLYDRQSEGCGLTVYAQIKRNQIRGAVPTAWGDLATLLSVSMVDDSQFPAMRLAIKNHQAQGERRAASSFDLEAAPQITPLPPPPLPQPMHQAPAPESRSVTTEPETPTGPAKPDPSIAKAKAAGVDTRVFGVPLGEPLRLPHCATANERKRESHGQELDIFGALRGVQTRTTCQSDGAMIALMAALLGGKPGGRYIMLAKDSCPDWAYCEVVAALHEGNLAGVTVLIQKGAREDYIGKQLRAKYGKPTHKETANYQNEYGARYEVEELEWVLPGLHVLFEPGPAGGGALIVETETGRKAREAKEGAQQSMQPKL